MIEAIKKYFSRGSAATDKSVDFQALPVEVNPAPEKTITRQDARLARLLTIENPSDEVLAEIKKLQEL